MLAIFFFSSTSFAANYECSETGVHAKASFQLSEASHFETGEVTYCNGGLEDDRNDVCHSETGHYENKNLKFQFFDSENPISIDFQVQRSIDSPPYFDGYKTWKMGHKGYSVELFSPRRTNDNVYRILIRFTDVRPGEYRETAHYFLKCRMTHKNL